VIPSDGGSTIGLIYGAIGSFLILLLAFFGVRKRWYVAWLGSLDKWLRSHIYLGLLVMVILALHTGGRLHDRVAVIALVMAVIVVGSGIFGAVMYTTVPRLLTATEGGLIPEQVSEELNRLTKVMARIASERSQPFQRIYDQLMRESEPGVLAGWRLLLSGSRNRPQSATDWPALVARVPRIEEDDLRELLVLSRQRKELLIRLRDHQRYRNILEAWLYVHVPFTFALIAFAAAHVAAVFYYGPIR
jgi:predicted membrane channel-forming protein YqfA (hemolysin III family)